MSALLPGKRAATALLVLYALAVAVVVFQPLPLLATGSVDDGYALLRRIGAPGWVTAGIVEFALNTVLFAPLTYLGSRLRTGWSVRRWVLASLAASALVELTQGVLLPHRDPSLVDIAANTLGGLLGALAARWAYERDPVMSAEC